MQKKCPKSPCPSTPRPLTGFTVHERSVESDFLLLALRRLCKLPDLALKVAVLFDRNAMRTDKSFPSSSSSSRLTLVEAVRADVAGDPAQGAPLPAEILGVRVRDEWVLIFFEK